MWAWRNDVTMRAGSRYEIVAGCVRFVLVDFYDSSVDYFSPRLMAGIVTSYGCLYSWKLRIGF